MAIDRRTVGGVPGWSKKRTKTGNKSILVMLAVVMIVAAGATLWYILDNRQTLGGALMSVKAYNAGQGISVVKTTEKQRYYIIETEKPEVSQVFSEFYEANIKTFRTQLQNLLEEKTLSKDDSAKLTIGFSAEAFEQYMTYTIHTEQYISEGNQENKIADYRMIFDGDTELAAKDLFNSDIDYAAKLSDLVGVAITELDGKLALTDAGLAVYSDQTTVIDYAKLYKLLAITLPERYKPVEPKPMPIDPSVEKVIALTFDDGPYAPVTEKLLDLLDQYNAKATFYVVGYKVDNHPELVRDIVARGHSIGIHSTGHQALTKMSDDEIKADIFGMQDKIEALCGVRPKTMRPVGGRVSQHIAELLNMPIILWDCDPKDWEHRDADLVARLMLNTVHSGDIVVSHDLYETTYEAYTRIIPTLAEQGYRFVTVEELIGYTEGAYAGKTIRYRELAKELRQAGAFEQ